MQSSTADKSRKYREKKKQDPSFLAKERERKRIERKRRNEDQIIRDRVQGRKRAKSFRQRQKERQIAQVLVDLRTPKSEELPGEAITSGEATTDIGVPGVGVDGLTVEEIGGENDEDDDWIKDIYKIYCQQNTRDVLDADKDVKIETQVPSPPLSFPASSVVQREILDVECANPSTGDSTASVYPLSNTLTRIIQDNSTDSTTPSTDMSMINDRPTQVVQLNPEIPSTDLSMIMGNAITMGSLLGSNVSVDFQNSSQRRENNVQPVTGSLNDLFMATKIVSMAMTSAQYSSEVFPLPSQPVPVQDNSPGNKKLPWQPNQNGGSDQVLTLQNIKVENLKDEGSSPFGGRHFGNFSTGTAGPENVRIKDKIVNHHQGITQNSKFKTITLTNSKRNPLNPSLPSSSNMKKLKSSYLSEASNRERQTRTMSIGNEGRSSFNIGKTDSSNEGEIESGNSVNSMEKIKSLNAVIRGDKPLTQRKPRPVVPSAAALKHRLKPGIKWIDASPKSLTCVKALPKVLVYSMIASKTASLNSGTNSNAVSQKSPSVFVKSTLDSNGTQNLTENSDRVIFPPYTRRQQRLQSMPRNSISEPKLNRPTDHNYPASAETPANPEGKWPIKALPRTPQSAPSPRKRIGQSVHDDIYDMEVAEKLGKGDSCPDHPAFPAVYSCVTCGFRPACLRCPVTLHRQHELEDIILVLERKRSKIRTKLETVRHVESSLESRLRTLDHDITVNREKSANLKSRIDNRFEEMYTHLKNAKMECISQCEEAEKHFLEEAQMKRDRLIGRLQFTKAFQVELTESMKSQSWKQLDDAEKQEVVKYPDDERNVEVKQLQFEYEILSSSEVRSLFGTVTDVQMDLPKGRKMMAEQSSSGIQTTSAPSTQNDSVVIRNITPQCEQLSISPTDSFVSSDNTMEASTSSSCLNSSIVNTSTQPVNFDDKKSTDCQPANFLKRLKTQ